MKDIQDKKHQNVNFLRSLSINGKDRVINLLSLLKKNNANEIKHESKLVDSKINDFKKKEYLRRMELASKIRKMEINLKDQLIYKQNEREQSYLEIRFHQIQKEVKILSKKDRELHDLEALECEFLKQYEKTQQIQENELVSLKNMIASPKVLGEHDKNQNAMNLPRNKINQKLKQSKSLIK